MLSKLLKYELKATARTFLPLFLAVLIMATLNRVFSLIGNNLMEVPEIISISLYVFLVIGMFVMTLIVMIQRFFKNLLSDEGYLMFTLPVRPWMHITSKLLVSMLWSFLSFVTALLSIGIIASEELADPKVWQSIGDGLAEFYSYAGTGLLTIEFIALVLVSTATNVLMIYAAIALGHLAGKQRILASIGAYLGLNTALQLLAVPIGFIPGFAQYLQKLEISTPADGLMLFQGIFGFGLAFTVLSGIAFYAITHLVLTKKLNLE